MEESTNVFCILVDVDNLPKGRTTHDLANDAQSRINGSTLGFVGNLIISIRAPQSWTREAVVRALNDLQHIVEVTGDEEMTHVGFEVDTDQNQPR